jgi:hypothetical protein
MKLSVLALFLLLCLPFSALPAERAQGVNQVLEILPDARSAGTAGNTLGLPPEVGSVLLNPSGLTGIQNSWISATHTEYFEGTSYDHLAGVLLLSDRNTLGFALSRTATDGIPLIDEGEVIEGSDYRTFGISEWAMSLAFARLYGAIELGVNLHILYRDLDQTGLGLRTDLGAGYRFSNGVVAAKIRSLSSSAAVWESGYTEYSSPELFIGGGYSLAIPYFYGQLHLSGETPGVFRNEARGYDWLNDTYADTTVSNTSSAKNDLSGSAATEDFGAWVQGVSLGAEFVFEWGGVLRTGFRNVSRPGDYTLGAGLYLTQFLRADYAWQRHNILTDVHRVSLSFSPGHYSKTPDRVRVRPIKKEKDEIQRPVVPIYEDDSGKTLWEE